VKVLVACEFSGIVREAFRKRGHDAWSCDLLSAKDKSKYHIQDNVLNVIPEGWDMMIAFPPCTYLCVSGARWFNKEDRRMKQCLALIFIQQLMGADINKIAIENPIGIISTRIKKPDQIVQPWMFGHGETKATCLWLKNLPRLEPTNIVSGRQNRIHKMAPSPTRGMERSITYPGIAQAMAAQWSIPLPLIRTSMEAQT